MSKSKSRSQKQARELRRRLKNRSGAGSSVGVFDSASFIAKALERQKVGQLQEAESLYRAVIEKEPENPDAWHLLGMTLYSLLRLEEAIECLHYTITLTPNATAVYTNLGVVYRAAKRIDDAQLILEKAVEIDPNYSMAVSNLGTVYMENGKLDESERQLQNSLAINPDSVQAKMNLANLWQRQNRFVEAENVYRDLLLRQPNSPLLLNNLGESLRQQGDMDAAVDAMQKAVDLAPDSYDMRYHLGRYLGVVDRREDAERELGRLIEEHPNRPQAYTGLGRLYLELGEFKKAESNFREAVERDSNSYAAHGTLLYMLSSKAGVSQQEVFEEHRKWGQLHGNVPPLRSLTQWQQLRDRTKNRRLKIGYVSPDFRNHVVKYFFEPVLQNRHRSQFEIYCYGEVYSPDKGTEQLQELSDHWRFTVGLSDEQVAKQVLNDEIDILVDLAGHTGGNRLRVFAFKPAPIQVTWLGYPNTTGLETIDYRLCCETQNPIGEPTYHTEELFRMPNASFCFAEPKNTPAVNELPATEAGIVTFGALHRPEKVSDDTLDLWARVLQACPESKLIVFHTQFNDVSKPMLIEGLVQRGVDRERIAVENDPGDAHYLEIYHRVDIALDVIPWAGSTTTMEALWMGVPVVAFYGTQRSSRATAVIMKNVGHDSLIADSHETYCGLVRELSLDLERLRSLRSSLRTAVSVTIADGKRFTVDLENSFREMWHLWCDGD